jgi:hypothetical protein
MPHEKMGISDKSAHSLEDMELKPMQLLDRSLKKWELKPTQIINRALKNVKLATKTFSSQNV